MVLVGAASKGIIQRGFQHNAMVYKTPYAKNPFDAITDQELDQYKKDIERKQKGDPCEYSLFKTLGWLIRKLISCIGKNKCGSLTTLFR